MKKLSVFVVVFLLLNVLINPVNAVNGSVVGGDKEEYFDEGEYGDGDFRDDDFDDEKEWEGVGNEFDEDLEKNYSDDKHILVDIEEIINVGSYEENSNLSSNISDKINESYNESNVSENLNLGGDDKNYEVNNSSVEDTKSGGNEERFGKLISEKRYDRQGRLDIEFEIEEDRRIGIDKSAIVRSDGEVRVRISSDEHFENPLRVYSDLPRPAREEDIRIFWETNDIEVTNDAEVRYEEYNEGLVSRISWIVPHLSTQYYRIVIEVSDGNGGGDEISLKVSSPENGSTVGNPINFNVEVNYSNVSLVDCQLEINGEAYGHLFGEGKENFTLNLGAGQKNWNVECWHGDKRNFKSGYFNVENNFSIVEDIQDFYLSNLIGEKIGGRVLSPGDNVSLKLRKNGGLPELIQTIQGTGVKDFEIASNKISGAGNYELILSSSYYANESHSQIVRPFVVGSASVKFEKTEINLGDSVRVELSLNNPSNQGSYNLIVGNTILKGGVFKSVEEKITFNPSEVKTYSDLRIILYGVGGGEHTIAGSNTLKVVSGNDTEKPRINLIYPSHNEILNSSEIEFRYSAKDNVNLKNCTVNLYNSSQGVSDKKIFPISSADKTLALKNNPANDEIVKVKVLNFKSGEYYFEVECFDNSSNSAWDLNAFKIDLGDDEIVTTESREAQPYEQEDFVKELIDIANNFLESESKMNLDEREISKILGVGEKVNGYKKILVQYDNDLKFDMRFMTPERREQRIAEIYEDIKKISKDLPKSLRVTNNYEYSKASTTLPISEIVETYMDETNTAMSKGNLKNLVKANEDMQKRLEVNVKIRNVKYETYDGAEDLVVVVKEISLDKDSNTKEFLEYLPETISRKEINFVTDVESHGENLRRFHFGDLESGNLVYYFRSAVPFDDIEETETILFSENVRISSAGITGFVVGGGSGFNFWWGIILLVLVVGYVGMVVFNRMRLEAWRRKEPNVDRLLELLSQTKNLVFENNLAAAHEKYSQMKELYKVVPIKTKKFFYNELKVVRVAINKKDIMNLVKEYEGARREFRKDDAQRIYQRITEVYRNLPKKYQEKVYQRVVKGTV